jgi:mannose-6-phosphate isomerase-like protein (cupin superfamily)
VPVFQSGPGRAPSWSELEFFEIVRLASGEAHEFKRIGAKEKLIVGAGACRIAVDAGRGEPAEEGANLDLGVATGSFRVAEIRQATTLIRMCGRWDDDLGGSGLFPGVMVADPHDGGDVVDYPKQTNFDRHFHDCDEHWIVFEGSGEVITEGKRFSVAPGDCIATGMGHHHDMPIVHDPIRAVFFETTMEGQKRRGHLWDHKHGAAEPRPERI